MNVAFSKAAIADLEAIDAYISQFDNRAAKRLAGHVLDAVSLLEQFPALGRPGQHFGTRELPIASTNYIVVYEGFASTVNVLRIWDGRQGGRPILQDNPKP